MAQALETQEDNYTENVDEEVANYSDEAFDIEDFEEEIE